MKRWTLDFLIRGNFFGFDKKRILKKWEPLEEVQSITYPIEDNNKLYVNSDSRTETFRIDFYKPIRRVFKEAKLFLGATPEGKEDGHLLIFELGAGQYGLLAPTRTKEELEGDED